MGATFVISRLQGEEELIGNRARNESVREAGEELLPAPDRPQHLQGQGEDRGHKLDDPGPGAVQDARDFFKT